MNHTMSEGVLRLAIVLTGLLIGSCIYFATLSYKTSSAIDFYQYWGVGMAQKLSGDRLSSPYIDIQSYDSLLNNYVVTSSDVRLSLSNRDNRGMYNKYSLEVNATPLLYALYALLPANFSLSYGIFLGIRVVLFLAALMLLSPDWRPNIIIAGLFCVFFYEPIGSDARVGNLNTLQFFVMAASAYFIESEKKDNNRNVFLRNVAVLGGIILMVLLKPNFIPIALALSLSLAVRQGMKMFFKSAAIAGILGLIFYAVPCVYFKSWLVWSDWFSYLSHSISSYNIQNGNLATFLFVSKMFNLSANFSKIIIAMTLVVSSVYVLNRVGQLAKTIRGIIFSPYLLMAIAITFTHALSPLVWFHYYVMMLIPVLWMITMQSSPAICRFMGMLSFFLSSGFITKIIGVNDYFWALFVSSWIPLWVGVLILISRMKIIERNGEIVRLDYNR